MFTGIVTAVGQVRDARRDVRGRVLRIDAPYDDLALGESVAVDGACLTVEELGSGWFGVHVIATSLDRTNFGRYAPGRRVNLERALRVGDRLGGHLVQGHVDGVGVVERVTPGDGTYVLDIRIPPAVAAATIPLGSITIDGVSLTVNALPEPTVVQIALIPFTLQHTTLGERHPGDPVHVEGDLIGKHVAEMLRKRGPGIER